MSKCVAVTNRLIGISGYGTNVVFKQQPVIGSHNIALFLVARISFTRQIINRRNLRNGSMKSSSLRY